MESYKDNLKKTKLIIEKIELNLKQNVGPIISLINEDNDTFAEKTALGKLMEIIEQIKSEEWILGKSSKKYVIEPIGNIGVVYDGNPYIFFYLCLKAIKTNNSITFFETRDSHNIANYVMEIVNNFIDGNVIEVTKIEKLKDISNYEKSVEKFICVGEHRLYEELKKYINAEIIYSAYGTMSLYMDDTTLKDKLLKIDDYVFENNISLELYVNQDMEDVVRAINTSGEDFCSVIFTKSVDRASYFVNEINSKMIFVNKNPFNEYKLEIDDSKLVRVKKIFI